MTTVELQRLRLEAGHLKYAAQRCTEIKMEPTLNELIQTIAKNADELMAKLYPEKVHDTRYLGY